MLPFNCLVIFLTLILGLPLFGLLLAGYSLPSHLTLFPISIELGDFSISWLIVWLLAAFIIATLFPAILRFLKFTHSTKCESSHALDFPWWGWIATLWVASSWFLAWTRFSWLEPWQANTFPLLWFGYIAMLNALTYQRAGQCMITHRPRILCQLFLLSAGFWWAFEYLNQYAKNWHYVNLPDTSHIEYFVYTSVSFSTVLPAVLSTYEWLSTFPGLTKPFESWQPLRWVNDKPTGWIFLISGSIALSLIGVWPTLLFPVLWLAPLGLLLGIQILRKAHTNITPLRKGDWRPVILSGLAALFCGFWWELWNAYSLVHWEYTIPYVHVFKIFEMPLLGYSGYLPFGLTCLAIAEFALGYQPNQQLEIPALSNQDTA